MIKRKLVRLLRRGQESWEFENYRELIKRDEESEIGFMTGGMKSTELMTGIII